MRTAPNGNLWRNRAHSLNSRARMFQAEGRLTAGDLREIVNRDRSACVYCGLGLDTTSRAATTTNSPTFDHVIRLADGGSNTHGNVVCACRGCNQRNARESLTDPVAAALKRLRWFLARKTGDTRLPDTPAREAA